LLIGTFGLMGIDRRNVKKISTIENLCDFRLHLKNNVDYYLIIIVLVKYCCSLVAMLSVAFT